MNELTYATVCSGIECMSVACRGLPLRLVFFSEIEPFPCAVLKAHYPDVPNLGDMSKIRVSQIAGCDFSDGTPSTFKMEITNGTTRIILDRPLDILAGGTPCQDVSVAGKRAGMSEGSGTRSSLAFDFVRLARELGPRWVLWENVAGSIDSKNAPDFLRFVGALGDCGYSLAWRVLDAQYVRVDGMERAVPQRRRRVWVVGCLGADESVPAQILFEPDCVAGHTPPRRRTEEGFAYSLEGRDRVDAPMVGEATVALDQGAGKSSVNTTVEHSPTLATTHQGEPCIALDGDKLKPREDQRKVGALPAQPGMKQQTYVVSTNSNGEDIAPTISSCEYKMGQHQKDTGGVCRDAEPLGIGRDVFNSGANASFPPNIRVGVQPTLTARTTQGAVCARLKGDE